jgi:O-antigen biosynthesis protein WbqV
VCQIACSTPKQLVLLDNSEFNLYEIDCTLSDSHFPYKVAVLQDVRDEAGLRRIFELFRPEIVFHAAALKHVPMLELNHNMVEAVLTNVSGTANVALLCAEFGSEMMLISSDKAVNPSSIMGMTKRAAEVLLHALSHTAGIRSFSQVRFGNVLGSSGSVVPLFRRQIAQGGPVTVTHPDMTRYLMTIKQAVQLTLSAADIHHVSQPGFRLYVLDMGEPVRIMDLAQTLIRQAGFRPNVDIPIEVIGIRPGEKLVEELAYPWERLMETEIPGVMTSAVNGDPSAYLTSALNLIQIAKSRKYEDVRSAIQMFGPRDA